MNLNLNGFLDNFRSKFTYFKLPHGTIPTSLMEFLYRAKVCSMCRNMSMRYFFEDRADRIRSLGQEVTSDGQFMRIRRAMCPKHVKAKS